MINYTLGENYRCNFLSLIQLNYGSKNGIYFREIGYKSSKINAYVIIKQVNTILTKYPHSKFGAVSEGN